MYRLWRNNHGRWLWEVRAGNYIPMLMSSKAHKSKDIALKEIKKVWRWAGTHYTPMGSVRYIELHGKNAAHQFVVLDEHGKPIAKSKVYKTGLSAHIGSGLAVELAKSNETEVIHDPNRPAPV